MKRYFVTVDVPFIVVVDAPDAEAAEKAGDELVAKAYDIADAAMNKAKQPVTLGNRYDDTNVEEATDIYGL